MVTRPAALHVTPAHPWQGLLLKSQPRKPLNCNDLKFVMACCRYFRPITARGAHEMSARRSSCDL